MTQDYGRGPAIPDDGSRSPVLSHILARRPKGVAVEFGVGAGDSARLIAKQMPLIGFDSAQGLPEDWRPQYPRGSFAFPLPDIDNTTMVEGWFENTLPRFDFAAQGFIGLVHFDADLYSSTAIALAYIEPYLHSGCYVVFDEFFGYATAKDHEQRAWRQFVKRTGITWTVVGHFREIWGIRIT